jgi:hypothetical protein
MNLDDGSRIDVEDPFSHHLDFRTANRRMSRNELPVDIREANLVVVDKDKMPNPATGKAFCHERADTADAEYRDARTTKLRG